MHKSPFIQSTHDFMLARHYSKRTISTCIVWIKAFINCNDKRHPNQMGEVEVIRFLKQGAQGKTKLI